VDYEAQAVIYTLLSCCVTDERYSIPDDKLAFAIYYQTQIINERRIISDLMGLFDYGFVYSSIRKTHT